MAHEDGETCRGLVATKGNERVKVRVRTSEVHATREDVVRCTVRQDVGGADESGSVLLDARSSWRKASS